MRKSDEQLAREYATTGRPVTIPAPAPAPAAPAAEETTPAELMGAAIRARAERAEQDAATDAAVVPAAAAPSEPRTPRGRWAAGLPNDLPASAVEGLEAAAEDFRAAVAREVREMRRFLSDAGVVSAKSMNDDQIRAGYASRTTNRVADVDGRIFGPGALVECVGEPDAVLNGERGRATAVGDDDQGGQWVRLTWTDRRGGMTRSANRVRVVDEPAPAEAALEAAGFPVHRPGDGDPGDMSGDAVAGRPVSLEEAEERRAVSGRVFASMQGMGDAVGGCTAYRMERARVGARELRIHGDAGELLGRITEHADGFRAAVADGRALTPRAGGPVFGTFVEAVAAVRFAGRAAQTDDQAATEAAGEEEGMGQAEGSAAGELGRLVAQGRDPRVDLRGPGMRQYATPGELGAQMGPADEHLAQAAEQGRRWCAITGQDDGGVAELLALVVKHGIGPDVLRGVADEMLRAQAGHVARVDAAGVIVHQGTGVDGYNVPRRMRAESLSWDGGAWQLPSHGSTTEIGEHDVAGALAWATGVIESRTRLLAYGLVPVGQMPHGAAEQHPAPTVTAWKHHRDAGGEWWEPVVR